MEIFFYDSPVEVPFSAPCSSEFFSDKQVLLISNKREILDDLATYHVAIMENGIVRISGMKVFVPIAVKETFLDWLKAGYPKIYWQQKTKFTDFKPEVSDELLAFFQQLRIVEKWERGTIQPESTAPQKTTMENNEGKLVESVTQAVLQQLRSESVASAPPKKKDNEDKFATATADASKYVSMGFAIVVIVSLLISLFSLKSTSAVRISQIDYSLNMASNTQTEEASKQYLCGMLANFFKSEVEKEYARRYTQVCASKVSTVSDVQVVKPQPPPLADVEKLKIISENYELAQRAIGNRDYTFIGNTAIEKGSALWYAKEIWNTAHADSAQKTEEILKQTVQYGEKFIKCPSIEKIHAFSCQHQKLQAVMQEITTKFPHCNLTSCPVATTSLGS